MNTAPNNCVFNSKSDSSRATVLQTKARSCKEWFLRQSLVSVFLKQDVHRVWSLLVQTPLPRQLLAQEAVLLSLIQVVYLHTIFKLQPLFSSFFGTLFNCLAFSFTRVIYSLKF